MEKLEEKIFEQVAELVTGYPEFSAHIKQIVEVSNAKKIIYHGIRNPQDIEKIREEGIKPLTPESGPCSFWCTGMRLFWPSQDSPFFNYSGNHISGNICELNLALTPYNLLLKSNLNLPGYESNSQIRITENVPFNTFSIINVKVNHPYTRKHKNLRRYRRVAEQILLLGIGWEIGGEIRSGEVHPYHEEVEL